MILVDSTQVPAGEGAGVSRHPPQQAQAQHLLQGEAPDLQAMCRWCGTGQPVADACGATATAPCQQLPPHLFLQPKKGGGISFNSTVTLTQCSEKLVQLILHEYNILPEGAVTRPVAFREGKGSQSDSRPPQSSRDMAAANTVCLLLASSVLIEL